MPTFRYHYRQVKIDDGKSNVFGLPKEVKLQGRPSEILDSLTRAGFKMVLLPKYIKAHYVPKDGGDPAQVMAVLDDLLSDGVGKRETGWACKHERADKLACGLFSEWYRFHLTWKQADEFSNAAKSIEPRASLMPKTKGRPMDVDKLLYMLFSGTLSFAPGADLIDGPHLEGTLHGEKREIQLSFRRESGSDSMNTKEYDPETETLKAEISTSLAKLPPGLEREEVFERLPPLAESLLCQLGNYTEMAQDSGYRGMAVWTAGNRTVEIGWQGETEGTEDSGVVGVTIKPAANRRSEQLRQYLIEQLDIDPTESVLNYEILDSPARPGSCPAL